MWDQVGNPEDRFSHNEAHMSLGSCNDRLFAPMMLAFSNLKCFCCSRNLNKLGLLGTSTEDTWPGISQLPDYKVLFQVMKVI